LPYRAAHRAAHSVPGSPSSSPAGRRISVASESRTFHSVRNDLGTSGASGLRSTGVSRNGYSAGITPASDTRPGGHHPPISSPQSRAARNATWSTPVWPPEMTVVSVATISSVSGCALPCPSTLPRHRVC
jgi:hypothetical protein